MHYRAEIDGLRALAILPVLFFHADFTFLAGGFLGVDVFFVISGYLITSIIVKELNQGRFSILKFYERRARRILPALSFVVFTTFLIGLLLLPVNALRELAQSIVSVAIFASNFYFFLTSNYFATSAEELLMVHTWSLAVEEQFYILFPLLLAALFVRKWAYTPTILGIMVLSFLTGIWIHFWDQSANFYLPFSRAWELLAGALVAIHYQRLIPVNLIAKNIFSTLGLALLILCYLYFDKSTLHPGPMTLLPILATVLLISFSEGTVVARALMFKPFIAVGLISYSLYLWHQPILAFIRIKSIEEPTQAELMYGVILAIVMAVFSWKYIEKPFRERDRVSARSVFLLSGFSLSLMFVIGSTIHFNNGWPSRFSTEVVELVDYKISPVRYKCHASAQKYISPEDACVFNEREPEIAVFGDSHTVELAKALSLKLPNKGIKQLSFGGCSPSELHNLPVSGCNEWLNEVLTFLTNQNSIDTVIIAYRHEIYFSRGRFLGVDNERYWSSLSEKLTVLSASGKKVFLLAPIPSLPSHIDKLITPFHVFSEHTQVNLTKVYSLDEYLKNNSNISNKIEDLKLLGIEVIPVIDIFCEGGWCSAVKGRDSLYFDDNHLSMFGAGILAQKIMTFL